MPEQKINPFTLAYLARYPQEAAQTLSSGDAGSIADLLTRSMPPLTAQQVGALLAALPTASGGDGLASLPADIAGAVLSTLPVPEIAELLTPLSAVTTRRLLSTLRPVEVTAVRRLLSYAPDSVGKRMRTRAAILTEGIKVAAARAMLPSGRMDTPAVAFVLDNQRRVSGMVLLQEIAAAANETDLDALIRPAPPVLRANQRLEEVRSLPLWREHRYLPVVGAQNRFLGVLEHADLIEALAEPEFAAREPDTDPVDVLLGVAETVWIPLARVFGKAASPLHPYLRSENRSHDESS